MINPCLRSSAIVMAVVSLGASWAKAGTFPNDACDNATALSIGSSAAGDNTFAITDDHGHCGTSAVNRGLWYKVVGNGEAVTISTCSAASFDTKIQVFCGCDLACVNGNDDFCGLQSSVSWCSQAGMTYYIHVGGFASATGTFTLSVSSSGSVCSPGNVCTSGACCDTDGSCFQLTENACLGAYQGDGTSCDTTSCPQPGACCFDAKGAPACAVVTQDNCGGVYHGDGTTCDQADCEATGACCIDESNHQVAGRSACLNLSEIDCLEGFGGEYQGDGTSCESSPCDPTRVDISKKGSLLIFSDVELEYTQGPIAGPAGWNVSKDTVISLLNDYPGDVYVQMYFINGDPEKDAIFSSGPAPILISEAEPGCNWVDCQVLLTPDQPVYWSAASGNPLGCQPFGILDPDFGNGPGRPNPDATVGPRVLRGYIIAWAVDAEGREINWNHLSGKATIVDYAAQAAWEYGAWAFQAQYGSHGETLPGFGFIALDGFEYDNAFDMLLFDFFAAGSMAFSNNANTVSVDTDLTLHPVSVDVRQEHEEPITTKAHFDIWNMNERKLSNTRRCITCWDQTLLSNYGGSGIPNNFLLVNMQSDKGKARIDGKQADECEENCVRDMISASGDGNQTAGSLDDLLDLEFICSYDAAILGVAAKTLRFGNNTIDYAGSELVGQGVERAFIAYDVVGPPGTLREDTYNRIRAVPSKATRIDDTTDRGK